MAWFLGHYLSGGQGAPDDPRVSPLLADDGAFAASPPTLVITAELDPLRDEGEAYAERLRAAGVAAEATRYDGMFHGFFSLGAALSDGRRAVSQAADALARAIGSSTPASAVAATIVPILSLSASARRTASVGVPRSTAHSNRRSTAAKRSEKSSARRSIRNVDGPSAAARARRARRSRRSKMSGLDGIGRPPCASVSPPGRQRAPMRSRGVEVRRLRR